MQGVAVLSHTFDTINPMARTVEDTTLALVARSDFTAASERQALSELRFAVVEEDQLAPLEATVAGSRQRFLHLLESAGCRLETFRFPLELAEIQARNGAIMTYEAYSTLQALIDDPAADLDPHVRQRIRGGADISAADYDGLLRQRAQDIGDFRALFAGFDILILPTTPLVAPTFSEVDESRIPLSRLTRAGNYYDLCGISLPCTPPRQPLPTGLQLLMRHGEHARLLAVARKSVGQGTRESVRIDA